MKKIMVLANKDNVIFNFRSELMFALKNEGYEVVFVCPYGQKLDVFLSNGFRNIDIRIDRRGKNLVKDIKLLKQYKQILKKEKPDLVLTYTGKPSIYGGFLCGKYNIPYIVNNAGLMSAKGFFKHFMNFLYKKGYSKASCLMFQNHEERDYFLKLLKNKPYYRDIPGSGVNLDKFEYSPYPPLSKKIIFNFVARIARFKGICEYLDCAKVIHSRYPNTVFRIFGDYDEDYFRDIIVSLSQQKIVDYKGVVVDMKPWIKECHAVIHPSHYEGMTNVVLEHSAIGRPCIGSNIAGVREGIEDGKTGYLFEVNKTQDLIDKVESFINLPYEEKAEMGLNARRKMENDFDRNIITNIYLEEIERLIGK